MAPQRKWAERTIARPRVRFNLENNRDRSQELRGQVDREPIVLRILELHKDNLVEEIGYAVASSDIATFPFSP